MLELLVRFMFESGNPLTMSMHVFILTMPNFNPSKHKFNNAPIHSTYNAISYTIDVMVITTKSSNSLVPKLEKSLPMELVPSPIVSAAKDATPC